MKTISILILILIAFLYTLNAANPQDIVGTWMTPENKSIIQIEYKEGKYSGKILRINPAFFINDAILKDINNKEPAFRSRSLEGLTILSGISYDQSKKRWNIECIYDPERGKYFEGYIILDSRDEIRLRGHVPGKKWLGNTEVWKRVEGESPY